MNSERYYGRVKWFNPKTGYGFIVDCYNEGKEYFSHHSKITTKQNVYKTLYEGEYVEYYITTESNGKELASDITGLNRGPLLCENENSRLNRNRNNKGRSYGSKTSSNENTNNEPSEPDNQPSDSNENVTNAT